MSTIMSIVGKSGVLFQMYRTPQTVSVCNKHLRRNHYTTNNDNEDNEDNDARKQSQQHRHVQPQIDGLIVPIAMTAMMIFHHHHVLMDVDTRVINLLLYNPSSCHPILAISSFTIH